MSSGEEFEVEEILKQRNRKGVLEYLVRWQGFNNLYDSWEPASGLTHCAAAVKAFLGKNQRSRSKSRSRSRSRGRSDTKSKSRSRSRGRTSKSDSKSSRSRSRSASRKTTQLSTVTSRKSTSEVVVAKKEASPAKQESRGRRSRAEEQKASTSKTEVVSKEASARKEGGILERKTEVVKTSVETVQSTPLKTQSSTMTTRSRLVVRQVENDQKPASKSTAVANGKETWIWWFADHIVLILFILVSIIALSFTIEGISEVRDKLVPDLGVLRQRLGESYEHFVQALSQGFNTIVNILPTSGDNSAGQKVPPASPTPKGA